MQIDSVTINKRSLSIDRKCNYLRKSRSIQIDSITIKNNRYGTTEPLSVYCIGCVRQCCVSLYLVCILYCLRQTVLCELVPCLYIVLSALDSVVRACTLSVYCIVCVRQCCVSLYFGVGCQRCGCNAAINDVSSVLWRSVLMMAIKSESPPIATGSLQGGHCQNVSQKVEQRTLRHVWESNFEL